MAPRRQAKGDEPGGPTEQAILRATEEILERTSISELSVRDVLEGAEVSRATFYFYFGSKYAAVAALFRRILEDVLEAFDRHWAASDDPIPSAGCARRWRRPTGSSRRTPRCCGRSPTRRATRRSARPSTR